MEHEYMCMYFFLFEIDAQFQLKDKKEPKYA